MNNSKFSHLFEDNRFLFLISLLISVVLWGYVVVYVNNQDTTTIYNVPINMQYRASVYQAMGLDVIETDISSVNVSVTGPRSVTGDLKADDIIVYPNITGIDGAGSYTLQLTADPASSVKNFTINSISHDTVTVSLDRLVTKEFAVVTDISSIVVGTDLMADRATANPSTLTITGPEYKVNTIDRVVAATISNDILTQSTVLTSEVSLYDENGGQIDSSLLTFNANVVDITVPILKEVTLPVKVDYIKEPSGFDVNTLKQSLSVSSLRLAVPAQTAASLSDFVVGYLDLSALELDKAYSLEVKMPTGYYNLDEIARINVTIPSENLTERTVSVSDIKVINDANSSIQVLTQIINNVVIVGESEVVENLTDGDVIAQIDASRLSAAQGQQSVEVSFVIPSTDKAYVKGTYTVTIKI